MISNDFQCFLMILAHGTLRNPGDGPRMPGARTGEP